MTSQPSSQLRPSPLPLPDAISLSGLSREQVGRMFAVSYRTVAFWLRTGHVPAGQRQQADRVCRVVTDALTATTSATARSVLLNSASGPSLYQQLLESADQMQLLQVPAVTPTQALS